MSDNKAPGITQATGDDGYHVRFFDTPYGPDDIDAELPDGTVVRSVFEEGGPLGFDRELPQGTWIRKRGVRTWGPIGETT